MANIERLRHLITVMQRVQDEHADKFDMGTWIERNKCGTVGCAAGWAAMDPEFQKQGFLPSVTLYNSSGRGIWTRDPELASSDDGWLPRYWLDGEKVGDEADFFDLNNEDSDFLFMPNSYNEDRPIQPKHVIEHINTLLAKYMAQA